MNIVFFAHPTFLGHQSMPRFAQMLAEGMRVRGHQVDIWAPDAKFFKLSSSGAAKKWFGYIDQYVIFPQVVRKRLKAMPPDTLFVFTDHALGPWVPLVSNRIKVVHCHDFLAQRSASGEIQENSIGLSGRLYQKFIHNGYTKGQRFISVSKRTEQDLLRFLPKPPVRSEVVYIGLNQKFDVINPVEARQLLSQKLSLNVSDGFILHVGGNQFYKNRKGVIELYDAWRTTSTKQFPLLLIGEAPNQVLLDVYNQAAFKSDIHFLTGISDEVVRLAYAGASVFLFPSLAEGFGWPIAEAMASGCPVITTDEAPMTEVAGEAAFLISRRPATNEEAKTWAMTHAQVIEQVVQLPADKRKAVVEVGLRNANRFDTNQMLNRTEEIYQEIVDAGVVQ